MECLLCTLCFNLRIRDSKNKLKSKGLMQDPWRTPVVYDLNDERKPFTRTLANLSDRKLRIHANNLPRIPKPSRACKTPSRQTESYAFSKSRKAHTATLRVEKASNAKLCNERSWSSTDFLWRNPACSRLRSPFASEKCSSHDVSIRSMSFDTQERRHIGL